MFQSDLYPNCARLSSAQEFAHASETLVGGKNGREKRGKSGAWGRLEGKKDEVKGKGPMASLCRNISCDHEILSYISMPKAGAKY